MHYFAVTGVANHKVVAADDHDVESSAAQLAGPLSWSFLLAT